jgi:hypothetical protein
MSSTRAAGFRTNGRARYSRSLSVDSPVSARTVWSGHAGSHYTDGRSDANRSQMSSEAQRHSAASSSHPFIA